MLNNDHAAFEAAQSRAAAAVSCESVVLPSGLTVLCRTMPGYSSVHAIYATGFGSIHRAFKLDGRQVTLPAGTAHFLEHKMCETPKGDSFNFYAKTGASANAFTSYDRTCYLFSATQKIDENLDILLGMVGKPWFTKATIAKEQGIIGQEIKMYDDSPDWRLLNALFRCLYADHPLRDDIAGTVEMLPETLEVRGQQADIMQISYAQVTLDIENASSTVVELLDYELYDFNDQLIESKNIHPMSENVQVTMPVLKVKDVPLTVNFIESAGSRLENYTYTLSHSSITLSGDATQMAGISEISLGTLALEDVQGSETLTYDILIPAGVNNLSGITSATLTISSGDISTKEVEATHFSYENFSGNHTVTVVTSSLPVTLRGSASDLEAVYGSEVHVIADLSDIAADSGSYTVPARIEVSGYDVGAVGTYEVTVHIS